MVTCNIDLLVLLIYVRFEELFLICSGLLALMQR
jgi:hypothetical protein